MQAYACVGAGCYLNLQRQLGTPALHQQQLAEQCQARCQNDHKGQSARALTRGRERLQGLVGPTLGHGFAVAVH